MALSPYFYPKLYAVLIKTCRSTSESVKMLVASPIETLEICLVTACHADYAIPIERFARSITSFGYVT